MSDIPQLGYRRPTCPPLILRGRSRWSAVQSHPVLFSSLGNRKEAAVPPWGKAGWSVARERAGGGWGAGCRCRGVERRCREELSSFPCLPFYALLVSVPERRMVFPLGL